MTTPAAHNNHDTTPQRVLFLAFELNEKTWKLGFTTGHGQKPRERGVTARHQEQTPIQDYPLPTPAGYGRKRIEDKNPLLALCTAARSRV